MWEMWKEYGARNVKSDRFSLFCCLFYDVCPYLVSIAANGGMNDTFETIWEDR
jgi:hypothetical protein